MGPRHDLMTDPADSRRPIHLAGGLQQDLCPGLPAEDGGEALPLGADPLPVRSRRCARIRVCLSFLWTSMPIWSRARGVDRVWSRCAAGCDVHHNPVKHGGVTRVADWPHSTRHSSMKWDSIFVRCLLEVLDG